MTDETTTPEAPAPEQEAIEAEARGQGWRPQDEYHGEGWVDASTFVQRGREILPIVQSQNRRLKDEQARTKAELEAVKATMKEFAEFHRGVEQRAYYQAMEDLKVERHAAVEAGDGAEVVRLERQMEVVHQQSQQVTGPKVHEPPPETASKVSEEMQEWQVRHPWFGPDALKTGIAMAEGQALQSEDPDLVGRPFLKELDRRLLVNYPGKFGPLQNRVEGPGSGGSSPGSKGKKTFANLPEDAKAACTKFVTEGWVTQEQYLKEYDWSE